MKILYIHQHFSTPKGCTGIRSYAMARKLIKNGHQVTMVCGSSSGGDRGLEKTYKKGSRRGNVDGIDVIEFDLSYSNYDNFRKRTYTFLRFALKSARIAMVEEYDLLFATTTPLTVAVPGILAKWLRRKPFIFEVRDLWPELPREMGVIRNRPVLWCLSALEWLAYKSADKLIALSPGMRKGVMRFGAKDEDVTLIPNGSDLEIFAADSIAKWRPKGVSKNDLIAIYAGAHGIANGLEAVLDAAAILKTRDRNDIKLLLVGDGKMKPQLVERAERQLLSNVIFHDPIDKGRLAGLLSAVDVGLQIFINVKAIYYGTSPNKFFDYLAAGLPVITNYPGWVADIINESCCGIAVPANEPEKFADKLEFLADNKAQLAKMRKSSQRLAKNEFNTEQLSDKFVKWLESV